MDFFRTMAILGLTVGIPTHIGLWLRSRMRDGSPAGGVDGDLCGVMLPHVPDGVARAASVELTAEPSPGAAPTGAVLARTAL